MFTYFFTVKFITMWIKPKDAYLAYLGGFLAAFYTAFSFTFWNNAIEAEVYVLNHEIDEDSSWVYSDPVSGNYHRLLTKPPR